MQAENRRKFIRLKAYHLAKYRPVSGDNTEVDRIIASVKDIGAGGICFVTEERLPVSSLVEIKINFPHLSEPVCALAKIAWVKSKKNSRRYRIGAEFVKIEDSTRQIIDDQVRFVEGSLKKRGGFSEILLFRREGGQEMNKFSKVLIVGAVICVVVAMSLKLTRLGQILPGPQPFNWAKLADTILLFSIAVSLALKK